MNRDFGGVGCPALMCLGRAVIAGQLKYIYDPEDVPELYDLENDPLEMHNLAAADDGAAILHGLHEECRQWGETHGDHINF